MRAGSLTVLATAALLLSACLPDSESVREKRLQDFTSGEAASFASSLSAYATQTHNALLHNAAFLNGTLAQGEVGRSLDGVLANGYCREGSGDDVNHMLLTWYTQTDRDGEFAIKGIGKGAGAGIVAAMADQVAPRMIGYRAEDGIRLRGPRGNGKTELAIPSGCDLAIPAGAPVLVVENLSISDQAGLGGDSYEYRTVSCADENAIGARTERRFVQSHGDGRIIRGDWELHDDTCGGAISTRGFTLQRARQNVIGALDLTETAGLQGALSGLSDLDCVRASADEAQTGTDGTLIDQGRIIVDTCNTNNIDLSRYKVGAELQRTDQARSREELVLSCGAHDAGTFLKGEHNVSHMGYTGTLEASAWEGNVSYERFTYDSATLDGSVRAIDAPQKGLWQGHTLNCSRDETMWLDCYEVFPEYRRAAPNDEIRNWLKGYMDAPMRWGEPGITPIKLDGMVIARTVSIEDWQTKSPPVPNPPKGEWRDVSAACEWRYQDEMICERCPEYGEGWGNISGWFEVKIEALGVKRTNVTEIRRIDPTCGKTVYFACECSLEDKDPICLEPSIPPRDPDPAIPGDTGDPGKKGKCAKSLTRACPIGPVDSGAAAAYEQQRINSFEQRYGGQ